MKPLRIDPINPESLGAPRGYSNGMLVRGDCDLLFVAGQIGWDASQRLVSDRFGEQFAQALDNVLAVVRAAGGGPESIVRVDLFVTSKREYLAELAEVGAAWRAKMGRHFPAMALLEVKDLLEPGAKIEIEATAAVARRRPREARPARRPVERRKR